MKKILSFFVIITTLKLSAQYTKLLDCNGTPSTGRYPTCALTNDGNYIYSGMTYSLYSQSTGITDFGTIIKIDKNGLGSIQTFDFYSINCTFYYVFGQGQLYFDGTYFYSIAHKKTNGVPFLFKVRPNGSDFVELYSFDTLQHYLFNPIIFDGTYLYSSYRYGNGFISKKGGIFKIKPDGSNFSILHNFNSNAYAPVGTLLNEGSYLYGMTLYDSIHYYSQNGAIYGNIFKIKTDGSEFTLIHQFDSINGRWPYEANSLIYNGGYLYGMTTMGGTYDLGIIFKIKPDGSEFTKIFEFNRANGAGPIGTLVSDSTYFYATAVEGGVNDLGVVFKIKPDGSDFTKILEFDGIKGSYPVLELTLDGNYLYGCTQMGGVNDLGVVLQLDTNAVGLTEIQNQSNFSIYPNPAKNTIYIKADSKLIGETFIVYDNLGKSVLTGKILSENTTIELGELSADIYLFSIGENIKQTFKVVKE